MKDDDKTVIMTAVINKGNIDGHTMSEENNLKIVTKHFNEIYRIDFFEKNSSRTSY